MAKKYTKDPRSSMGIPKHQHFLSNPLLTDSNLIVSKEASESNKIREERKNIDSTIAFSTASNIDTIVTHANEYNLNIFDLDEDYTSIRLVNFDILIRLFKNVPENRAGLLLQPMIQGISDSQFNTVNVKDPYFMSNLGIIVNLDSSLKTNNNFHLKVGDIVQLEAGLEITKLVGGTQRTPVIQNSFYIWKDSNKPFKGYVKHKLSAISAIIASSENEKEKLKAFFKDQSDHSEKIIKNKANDIITSPGYFTD